jgi:hypothetical protein
MAVMRPFREDYRTSVPMLQGIVKWMNEIGHVLNNIHFASGDSARVMASKSGIKFILPLGGGDGATVGTDNSAFIAEARFGDDGAGGQLIEVKMLGGTVQGIFGKIRVFKTTYWTTDDGGVTLFPEVASDESDSGSESDSDSGGFDRDNANIVTGDEIEDGEIFWLEYDPNEDGGYDEESGVLDESDSDSGSDSGEGPNKGRWKIKHAQDLPDSATKKDVERALYFTIIPLFTLSLAGSVRNVIQYHFGSVYVPTVSNVVPKQILPGDDESDDSGAGA